MTLLNDCMRYFGFEETENGGKRQFSFKNVKSNWLLLISAMSFFCVSTPGKSKSYALSLFTAFIACAFVFGFQKSLVQTLFLNTEKKIRIVSIFSALGILVNAVIRFVVTWSQARLLQRLFSYNLQNLHGFLVTLSVCAAVVAFPFIYIMLCFFYRRFLSVLNGMTPAAIARTVPLAEKCVYLLLLVLTVSYATIAFSKSTIFYETPAELGDVLYTSDARLLVTPNAYLSLAAQENDLRQPLFAVFAAPFVAPFYLVSFAFGFIPFASALFMNYAQICLFFYGILLLAHCFSRSHERVCFVTLFCATYTYLLFSVMMEQYIVAFFYVSLTIALAVHKRRSRVLAFYGATGTLLTSVMFVPCIISSESGAKKRHEWIRHIVFLAIGFVLLMLFFCRGQSLFSFITEIKSYLRFNGQKIAFMQRLRQYTAFVSGCFVPQPFFTEEAKWRLLPVSGFDFSGIAIFFVCCLGFIVNREKLLAKIALAWIGYSFVLLCLIGWGTLENGLVLYSLYFSWAFFVLIFLLVQKMAGMLKSPSLVSAISVLCALFLLYKNIPVIVQLIRFGMEAYPC